MAKKKKNPSLKLGASFLKNISSSGILSEVTLINRIRKQRADTVFQSRVGKDRERQANYNALNGINRMANRAEAYIWQKNYHYLITYSNGRAFRKGLQGHCFNVKGEWADMMGKCYDRYYIKGGYSASNYFDLDVKPVGFCQWFEIVSDRTDRVVATCKIEVVHGPK